MNLREGRNKKFYKKDFYIKATKKLIFISKYGILKK